MTIVIITLLSLFIGVIKIKLCWRGVIYHQLNLVQEWHAMITSMQHVVVMILKLKMLHNYFLFMFFSVIQFHVVYFYSFSCTCLALFCVVVTPLNPCCFFQDFVWCSLGKFRVLINFITHCWMIIPFLQMSFFFIFTFFQVIILFDHFLIKIFA